MQPRCLLGDETKRVSSILVAAVINKNQQQLNNDDMSWFIALNKEMNLISITVSD